jgi:hypothetical protein
VRHKGDVTTHVKALSKVGVVVLCLLVASVAPVSAQLADSLSLAASGVLLPFFSDAAAGFDSLYATPPANLGAHTVPVWYTELEAQSVTSNPVVPNPQSFSFLGYWGLEVTGREATLFHRMSNASLDNLSFGTFNPFANR